MLAIAKAPSVPEPLVVAQAERSYDVEQLPGFLLAGFALAGSPGPATLSLAAAGAAFGARRGLRYMAGVVCGMVFVMAVTATGIAGVVLALPGAKPVVTVAATIYFIYLAYRIATAPPLGDDAGAGHQPSFGAGLFLSFVNPKGYAAMAALFSGFVLLPGRVMADGAAKMAVLLGVMIIVHGAWLVAGSALTRCFRDPGTNRFVNVAFAVLLIASVALALLF